jgi:hypothetical protein
MAAKLLSRMSVSNYMWATLSLFNIKANDATLLYTFVANKGNPENYKSKSTRSGINNV